MNHQLRKLMLKAGYAAPEMAGRAHNLAELVVLECAGLSVNSQYSNTKSEYYEGFNEALVYTGNKIRQHFGVDHDEQ